VPHYFKRVPLGPVLNQLDSPDFTWRTKHLLWDELNVLKPKLNVKIKKPPMITGWNQACVAK